ncbi:MAG: branched-chain amino acid ABC transporter permease [Methyloligellaceae bacterium]
MFYNEAGQFKTSYSADQAILPIRQDRYFMTALLIVAYLIIPFFINDYWANAIILPFLIYALAALGLNILTGYCGQLSLGTGAFLAVGAYASYKIMTAFPDLNLFFVLISSGIVTAAVGILFGLPSLRIKGFYLAVATLAAQFFIIWLFNKVPWFYNNNATGQITAPPREIFGYLVTGPRAEPVVEYLFTLTIVILFALIAKNIVRGRIGRMWMAIRDMDIAAELIGIRPLQTKLTAFAISSFYIGIAGGLMFTVWLGAAESEETFGIQQSFDVLFIIIIGGLGTILGAFLGAAFIVTLPVGLEAILVDSLGMTTAFAEHMKLIILGSLILFFLIVEPHGLARLWEIIKEKLRLWPFPH